MFRRLQPTGRYQIAHLTSSNNQDELLYAFGKPCAAWVGLQDFSLPVQAAQGSDRDHTQQPHAMRAGPRDSAGEGTVRDDNAQVGQAVAGGSADEAMIAGEHAQVGRAADGGSASAEAATAAGLVANSQLGEDSEELTGRLLALGVVLMLSLLLLVTAILTVPCFMGIYTPTAVPLMCSLCCQSQAVAYKCDPVHVRLLLMIAVCNRPLWASCACELM